MTNCYKYQDLSNLLYKPCHHFADLFSSDLWHHLLFGDYFGLAAVAGLATVAAYASYRKSRWFRLCAKFTGLYHENGTDAKTGKQLYSFAKIRIRRRLGLFGEVHNVSIYGLDTITPTNVEAAREAISNFVGVELTHPPMTGVGAVRMEVNHLVAKKNSFARRLGL